MSDQTKHEAPAEGEAVAWCIPGALDTMKADGLSGDIMPAADDEFTQPLYTHPAAPSADKLRIAVEALERIAHEPRPVTRAAMREYAAEALAALKAEGPPAPKTYSCTSGLPEGTCSCYACHGG